MADKKFPQSGLPIRKTSDLLPKVFQTEANDKFLSGVLDPLVQPGVLQKTVGYIGRRYGKTYNGSDIYLNNDETLRSRYQLEPGVSYTKDNGVVEDFYDYLDFKNQLKFFGNDEDRDDKITSQEHYSWNPPIAWDKFVNYREYYWEPSGPPPVEILGQTVGIVSTYKVKLGVNSFIFTPDGYTNNPVIKLFRGQTYKFKVDAPIDGFVIRTNYDVGTLAWKEQYPYSKNQFTIYDSKVWKALVDIAPLQPAPSLTNTDWTYVEPVSVSSPLDYNKGVTNNRIENGTLTFEVPFDAPDVLYYQSIVDPNKFGQFVIANAESNTKIDIENEIIGKVSYKSSNGVEFTNGLVVEFHGEVTPSKYSNDTWLVEGVGTEITLTKFTDLIVPKVSATTPEILFDNEGFDTQPFDDATQFPGSKDYITISRNSIDRNPWSRYNRWFHRSVLEYAYQSRGQDFPATESLRAKRPIIEFQPNIQLFNHGAVAKENVDYIDDFTTDVFSNIEGSLGYNIDGEFLFEGARILVIADTDLSANNKIYEVEFITHNNKRQIHLRETADTVSNLGEAVIVKRGNKNGGLMFHFDGTNWVASQPKTSVNQAPLFDAFDENGVSFANTEVYPVTTFTGTPIVGYKVGTSTADSELGFSLSYLNIDNIGDIQFEWAFDTETFNYTQQQTVYTVLLSTGFYKINPNETYDNGWLASDSTYFQPIIDSTIITEAASSVTLSTINWDAATPASLVINFYINGTRLTDTWTRAGTTFTFANTTFAVNDVVSVKVIADVEPELGYYEIPAGLEKNPLNQDLSSFTLGQAIDHVASAIEFKDDFSGALPGVSNLRDISEYQKYSKRFLKHSGLTPLTISLLCDKTGNIIKSIQYAKKAYSDFKNNFVAKAIELTYNENVADFVDNVIAELTRTKNEQSPFADSDMIGAGAFTSIEYVVDDTGIKTFSLSERFTLTELSRRAVYVYLNETQLLNSKDYEFNSTFGFVTLKVDLVEGDYVQIREYISTATSHIPPTPTSLGLYKKYTPMIFIDDTYVTPTKVIQGHDGSITVAYDDYRDDLLLELEYRIYNNIKKEYNREVFDIDNIVGSFYGNGLYTKAQLDGIIVHDFLKWIQNTNINYTQNTYFDSENSFTYTYTNMTDPSGTSNLPGYWRGVYQWFYDTDRPHRCPWEMLGFSEMPTWWEEEYGPAPYTSGNLLLWEDLQDGIIRQGDREGTYDRYKRPDLTKHIPADGDGKLLSPLDSGLAGNFSLIQNKGPFVLGDISPVEYAWRSSSEWAFSVVEAMSLLKPFEFITDGFDLSKTKINKIGQTVNAISNRFQTFEEITFPTLSTDPGAGLVKYLTGYLRSRGLDITEYETKLQNLNVVLSSRLSGFVDKEQQKYLLDSKSPKSASSSVFVPQENYDIIFNVSSPIASISYSGVILEKTEGGWIATGYDDIHPFFNYHAAQPNQRDPVITVGGVSENFLDWTSEKGYNNGQLVRYRNDYYRALKTIPGTLEFDKTQWKKLPDVPVVGGVEAYRRRTFNTLRVNKLVYGTKLTSIQEVIDFLLGYESYLLSIGFKFDRYDPTISAPQNWLTSCKEFMFWTKHNWAIGSMLTLSPSAEKVDITISVGVADNLLDGFYDYQVLKSDGKVLTPNYINVNRSFQNITVETTNTTNGIYFLKVYFVLKEHVVLFSDRTVFNDVIYDKTTGYRQERIKTQGFVTVDWDGDYTSPGFMFDNVDIGAWKPFTDYKSGDIVSYRSYNWTSLTNQLGTETFDDAHWTKLDSRPEKQLVANFDYKINQFEDYYEVSSDGLGNSQRDLARHAIGYQTREYLQNIAEDPVTQFQLYQGFIKEKGSANAITKVFNKLSTSDSGSVDLYEEWAFRVGKFGGVDQLTETEMTLYKDQFEINPQPMLVVANAQTSDTDQYYRILKSDFTIDAHINSTEINPTTTDNLLTRVAGYVRSDTVDVIVENRDAILDLDISAIEENNHIWVTFDNYSWTVLRYNESPILTISSIVTEDTDRIITLSRFHTFVVGDIIGIKNIPNLTGFFKITAIGPKTVTVTVPAGTDMPEFDGSTIINICIFTTARFGTYEELDLHQSALLKTNSKLWIDNNGSNGWEVVQKKKQFVVKELVDAGIAEPVHLGSKVIYNEKNKQSIVGIPGSNYVMVYVSVPTGLGITQILTPSETVKPNLNSSFGKAMEVSTDGQWLIVGSPNAGNINSYYTGNFNPASSYNGNDIVRHDNLLWKATRLLSAPEYPSVTSADWEVLNNLEVNSQGGTSGLSNQGLITIFQWTGQRWQTFGTFLSPQPAANEQFGSEIVIGQTGTTYYAAISAKGANNGKGKIYFFTSDGTDWSHLVIDNSEYSLPLSIASSADGSTLGVDAELLKDGDGYGSSMSISQDGNVLIVGAPNSDGQYFENYRGIWNSEETYSVDDVVQYNNEYYKLLTLVTAGVAPGNYGWDITGDSTSSPSGKVFVYSKDVDNKYQLKQTIDAGSLVLIDDTPTQIDSRAIATSSADNTVTVKNTTGMIPNMPIMFTGTAFGGLTAGTTYYIKDITRVGVNGAITISRKFNGAVFSLLDATGSLNIIAGGTPDVNVGDQFGFSVDVDYTGTTLVVSSPKADINFQNQGSAYVFRNDSTTTVEFRLKQKLESYETYPNEYFGQGVSISNTGDRIAIGAKNSPFVVLTKFDTAEVTSFDQGKTRFIEHGGYAGSVYIFERKNERYFLVEKLEAELSPFESFGSSLECTDSVVLVGSPDYRKPVYDGPNVSFTGSMIGTVRLFSKSDTLDSWEVLGTEEELVDIRKIRSIGLYDNDKNIKIQDIDYVDHAKLKILNSAEREIKFKTIYDPATYTIGTEEVSIDTSTAWAEKHVGELWWDISKAKWKYYEQGDVAYRTSNWNSLAEGGSIDVYEWVETVLLPSEWAALADTNEGIAEGISGQPLYPNNDVYTIKELYSPNTGLLSGSLYYYWVKNRVVVPTNTPSRKLSAGSVANYISNPAGTGIAFIAIIAVDKYLAFNFKEVITSDTVSLNIEYRNSDAKLNPIHREYQLLTEGVADSLPTVSLETKWIDSLIGYDAVGNRVPDPSLPAKQKYGLSFRPRQSMFVDRFTILRTVIENINAMLLTQPFADFIVVENLSIYEEAPIAALNLYDQVVDNYVDLSAVGTTRVKQADLSVYISNGEIDSITILDPGFGYRVPPPVVIQGDGVGAEAVATIDIQGRIDSVTVTARGKKYTSASATIRQYSVLVTTDETTSGFWGIYSWDNVRGVFYKSQGQSYDTSRYGYPVDWWAEGYTANSRVVAEIPSIFEEPTLTLKLSDLIRVREYGNGDWAVFEKVADGNINFFDNYKLVGRGTGTLQLSDALWNNAQSGIGFDNTASFDTKTYDLDNSKELRIIFDRIKNYLLVGDYAVEWNNLFFTSVRYAFAEQQYIDWAFKTSFLNATHNVGELREKLNYKNDNLESYQQYINEVKPYRTTIREYISRYNKIDHAGAATTDFDLPPNYSKVDRHAVPVTESDETIQTYPWKWWLDNHSYSIVSIEVANPGSGYTQPPNVVITGTGTGAVAKAYISNGTVSGIKVITPGTGFTQSPTVSLVGGNGSNSDVATAVAIIGDTKVRTFNMGVKFDRLSKDGLYTEFTVDSEPFTANGYSAIFDLKYAPTRDKSKIQILKNNQLVLNNEYEITLYKSSSDTYSLLKGKIIFAEVPTAGDTILVTYEKNDDLLDSVNRIQKYYSPEAGMKGKDLGQLMTGIDYGGVQIQGTTFDVTGGWDALPWFTDGWDSVEASSDYYVVCDGSTTSIKLPYVPAEGQEINIYWKKAGTPRLKSNETIYTTGDKTSTPVVAYEPEIKEQPTVRIDDPYFNPSDESSTVINPSAQMPTFVGDGSTSVIEIGQYISTESGDTLIFRPSTSDGAVVINDPNLVDTQIDGGALSFAGGAYSSAAGMSAEDITIDGGKFVGPDQVPAPEENVPGQVLESVSIKVFTTDAAGAVPLQTRVIYSDGVQNTYSIGLPVFETKSLLVYVDKVKKEVDVDFIIDFSSNEITFTTTPINNATIEITAIGIGGVALLDYQEFIADGATSLFLTNANFADTTEVSVTVNGVYTALGFINSTGIVDVDEKTLIQFGTTPPANSIIKIVSIGGTAQTTGIVRVYQQEFGYDGSSSKIEIVDYVNIPNSSTMSSIVVELDDVALRGIDTTYATYDGVNNTFVIATDPEEGPGAVLSTNLKVFVNNNLLVFVQDYVYDGSTKEVIITSTLVAGDQIKIENDFRAEYSIEDNNLVLTSNILSQLNENDDSTIKNKIKLTWFTEYPALEMISDEYTGGKINYQLGFTPLGTSYVWVYKNGIRLVQDKEFYVSVPRGVVYLKEVTSTTDIIKVVLFGSKIYRFPSAYEIHKDMLNTYHFKRFSNGAVQLAQSLNYYDQQIVVTDASGLATPNNTKNIAGVILINNERIEYLQKSGNVLSQLRRGVQGTAIAEVHSKDSQVIDVSAPETIPYKETQEKYDFVSDGSTLLIGPLDFVPTIGTRSGVWTRDTIPADFGPCDQFEVFAGGKRLRKDPIVEYKETNGATSPDADETMEAEFSVNGADAYIRLTDKVPAGTRITIIKKIGSVWYEKGDTTVSRGVTLLENNTPIAAFIAKKSTILPE